VYGRPPAGIQYRGAFHCAANQIRGGPVELQKGNRISRRRGARSELVVEHQAIRTHVTAEMKNRVRVAQKIAQLTIVCRREHDVGLKRARARDRGQSHPSTAAYRDSPDSQNGESGERQRHHAEELTLAVIL
jgi:hypothetical protein